MAQPQWITKSGSLGTIPEGIFYQIPLSAEDPDGNPVYYELIAGHLPPGIQVLKTGVISGIPRSATVLQGVPLEVARDTTSKFAIRAYTEKLIHGSPVVDRVADRTFTLTIAGQDIPDFITPAGNIGTFIDGTKVNDLKIEFTDIDLGDRLRLSVIQGELPPGLVLLRDGTIKGVIKPLVGPPGSVQPGWDRTVNDEYPWQFTSYAESQNFQFTVEITDGKDSNVRTFSIFVYATSTFRADTTDITADNTFLTADLIPSNVPILLNPEGDLGRVRADDFYAYKFDAIDIQGDLIRYEITNDLDLPPGLTLDPVTGWFYGYIPNQGVTETTYRFAVRVYKSDDPEIVSPDYHFTITIIGDIDTEITWLTPSYLGSIDNGSISDFYVAAINSGGRPLSYRILSGSASRLPQGLRLLPSGHIVGKVSFNTFALDGGSTIFDSSDTTFDMEYDFTVNAYSPQTENFLYQVDSINVINGGTNYSTAGVTFSSPTAPGGITATGYVTLVNGSITGVTIVNPGFGYESVPDVIFDFPMSGVQAQGIAILNGDKVSEVAMIVIGSGYLMPTVEIAPPPDSINSRQATVGQITIVNGKITEITIDDPGRGYPSAPPITISGSGSGAFAASQISPVNVVNSISVYRRFKIKVVRAYMQPYENLYIKAMPPLEDRAIINQLILNQDIIPVDLVYRADDPNYGVAKNVTYVHAYGLNASTIDDYAESLRLNHYWKNLVLGEIKTAQATDPEGNVIYEVVYSQIIDDQVNKQGDSVSKSVKLPYPVEVDEDLVSTVYPNSLINMRNQVIDQIGQASTMLPLWMTSKQTNGRVLGFTPAWVIAYVKPGESARVVYNIRQQFGDQLNKIDFKADRYELDRSQTYNWDPVTDQWIPSPAQATIFDGNQTVFDGSCTRFITPADQYNEGDIHDKYLLYPRIDILSPVE